MKRQNQLILVAAVIGVGILIYRMKNGTLTFGNFGSLKDETTFPDTNQPNMKTKVPAGANTDHMWLIKG